MELNCKTKLVLFDLDNTLFDHQRSLRSAISIVQEAYPNLAEFTLEILITVYNVALQKAYDKYLAKEIMYIETDAMKVQLFFTQLGLPTPTDDEISQFRGVYKSAYRQNRRATKGSIETLVRLREMGYRLAIVTNGQMEDQEAKAEAIGVRQLVEHVFTSEEVGFSKPDARIFQYAMNVMGASPQETWMMGDSIEADVKGALNAGLQAIWYAPAVEEASCSLRGAEVPVINHMDQLPLYLSSINP